MENSITVSQVFGYYHNRLIFSGNKKKNKNIALSSTGNVLVSANLPRVIQPYFSDGDSSVLLLVMTIS